MYNPSTGLLTGAFVPEYSRLGTQGWTVFIDGSPDGLKMATGADIAPTYVKGPDDPEWACVILPSKVPAGMFNPAAPGGMGGTWFGKWASNTDLWSVHHNKVLLSTNASTTCSFNDTAFSTHIAAEANWLDTNFQFNGRTWAQKGAVDLSNANVLHLGLSRVGLFYTLDKGANVAAPTGLPLPSKPTGRSDAWFHIVAVDDASAMTGGATSRRSRVFACPSGAGPHISSNGGTSYTSIKTTSGAGNFTAASGAFFMNNKLYVCVTDAETHYYFTTTSAATGGAGTGPAAYVDNVRVFDFATETWSFLNHGAQDHGFNTPFFCFLKDTRFTNGFFIFNLSNEFIHTQDGTTFTYFTGNGYFAPNGARLHVFARCKPRFRPGVADRLQHGAGYALSNPAIIGPYLYLPTGAGTVRWVLADVPTAGYGPGDDPLGIKVPLTEEDTGGLEAKVGQCLTHIGDELLIGSQDFAAARWEDGRRGYTPVSYIYPPAGGLSDALNFSRGPIEGFAGLRRARSGQSAVAGWAYTLNGRTLIPAGAQPPSNTETFYPSGPATGNPYVPGGGAVGGGYSAIDLPGFPGTLPFGTLDIRSSDPWVQIKFWKGGTELNMEWDGAATFSGLQAATFSSIHNNVVWDPVNNCFYIILMGSGTNAIDPPDSWVSDPLDRGGVYKLALNDWPNARRVYAGNPIKLSNFGYFDVQTAVSEGKLLASSNYLTTVGDSGNPIVILDIATWTRSLLPTPPGNFACWAIGDPFPGDTIECLHGVAWNGSNFGYFFCRNWSAGTPVWSPRYDLGDLLGFPSYADVRRAVGSQVKKWQPPAFSLKNRGAMRLHYVDKAA